MFMVLINVARVRFVFADAVSDGRRIFMLEAAAEANLVSRNETIMYA